METVIFIVVLLVIFTILGYMVFKKKKKYPYTPPKPGKPKYYLSFLQDTETVLRSNISKDELDIYFDRVKPHIEIYMDDHRFEADFNMLLAKYGIPTPLK